MKKIFLLSLFISLMVSGQSQETSFTVSTQLDTLLIGNQLRVSFKLENGSGRDFTPPVFEDFVLVAGPNMSSSTMVVNGEVSQSVTYSYYLEAKEVGVFFIPPAKIATEESDLFTEPLEVIVLPNPEGIIQKGETPAGSFNWSSDFFRMPELSAPGFPKEKVTPKKKKRKTVKL